MIGGDRGGDILQHHRFAGARRATINARWPMPIGEIRSITRGVLSFCGPSRRTGNFPFPSSAGDRDRARQVVEIDAMTHSVRWFEIDLLDFRQREITFAILRRADLAFDGVAVRRP